MIIRVLCILIFLCLSRIYGYAHEVNKAFFQITEKDGFTEVRAEFPWTLRDALLDYNPDLNTPSVTKADFETTFVHYMDANLLLLNVQGAQLPLLHFNEIQDGGHSHQNTYLITYDGTGVVEVSNSVMFNIFDNQINYNDAVVGSQSYSFKTSLGSSGVILESAKSFSYFWLIFVILICLGLFLWVVRKRKVIAK